MTVTSGIPDPFGEHRRRIEELMRQWQTPALQAQLKAMREAVQFGEPTRQLMQELTSFRSVVPQLKASTLHPMVAALPTIAFGADARKHLEALTANFMPDFDTRIWRNFEVLNPIKIDTRWLEQQAAAVERLRATLEKLEAEDDLPEDWPQDAGPVGEMIGGLDSLLSLLRFRGLTVEQATAILSLVVTLLMWISQIVGDARMHEEVMEESRRQTAVLMQIADDVSDLPELARQAGELEDQAEEIDELRDGLEDLQAQLDDRDVPEGREGRPAERRE